MQSKLRRVLENGDYQRVGGAEILYANVRLISATNREPRQAMSDGQLDEDFFYRIADYELHVPPLRERKGDILPLAYHFLAREAARQDKPTPVLTQQLENTLLTYHWPGNVRQLRQEMRRAILHAKGHEIGIGIFLANRHREHFASANLQEVKQVLNDDLERRMITTTLRRCGGNVSQAAQILGYARPHLYRLMKKHGINPKEFRGQG